MKYKTLFFIFFSFIFQLSFSQKLQLEKGKKTLKNIIVQIENQSNFTFYYNSKEINDSIKITINKSNYENITQFLSTVFSSLSIAYKIKDKQVILLKEEFINVSGKVISSNKEPLPGVSIIVKNATQGTTSDFNGNFSIKTSVNSILVFSYLGMTTKEYLITPSSTNLLITLQEDTTTLTEIVLTGFGDVTNKEVVTGAIENIDVKSIENSSNTSLQENIQGSVTGVQVISNSGDPSDRPNIRIRGVGSIEASGYPIYVVDGVILDPIEASAISPSDVENISILKDAAATSIYGTKAANGVILITTKSGKEGKTEFSITSQYGFSETTGLGKTKPLNTKEFSTLLQEGVINAGLANNNNDALLYLANNTNFNPENNTDWYNKIIRQPQYHRVDFKVSGGTKKNQYIFSLGYQDKEGAVYNNDYNRIYSRLKNTLKLNSKLSITPSFFISKRDFNKLKNGGSSYNPIRSLHRLRPDILEYDIDFIEELSNPITIFREYTNFSTDFNFIGSLKANYKINNKFSIYTLFSTSYKSYEKKEILPKNAGVYAPYLTVSNENKIGRRISFRSFLRYKTKFSKYHKINTFIGVETINEEDRNNYSENAKVLPDLTISQGNLPTKASSYKYIANNVSTFINTQYDYKSKYLLSYSIRRDGSSRFGKNNRFGTFWSVGLGWNIHKESFMDNITSIDNLKFRVSYGVNGQDRISSYPSLGLYSDIDYGNNLGIILSQIPNPKLKWEENRPFDIGLNFSLFDYKLSGVIDWYSRKTSDLIINVPISVTNGADEIKRNTGSILNQGIEIGLKYNIFDNDFKWNTSFTYTKNNNKVLSLSPINSYTGISQIIKTTKRISVGKPINTFYLVGYAGVDPLTGEAMWYKDGTKTATTKVYNEATPFDQGNTNPDFYGSFKNYFSYKNFSLSTLIYTSWGGKVYDKAGRYLQNDGYNALGKSTTNVSRRYYENHWKNIGDTAPYPKYIYRNTQSGNPNQKSTRFLYNASFIRLKDVTLNYTFSKELLNKLNISKLKIFLKGTNLWTYVKDPLLLTDPETGISGELDQKAPIMLSYSIGIKIKF